MCKPNLIYRLDNWLQRWLRRFVDIMIASSSNGTKKAHSPKTPTKVRYVILSFTIAVTFVAMYTIILALLLTTTTEKPKATWFSKTYILVYTYNAY